MLLQDLLMVCVVIVNIASIICMGLIIAREPLSNPEHEIIHHDHNPADSPYKHGIYYGWAIAAGTAVAICAGLPIYSWFTTFRLSKSSMFCLATCLGKCSLLVFIPAEVCCEGIITEVFAGLPTWFTAFRLSKSSIFRLATCLGEFVAWSHSLTRSSFH
jgi:hypothetical protein